MVLVYVLKLHLRFWKGKATKEASKHGGDEKTSGFSRHSFHEPGPRAFKNSADGSSFLSCCLQTLPRSLTRALPPGQGEGWLFPSGQHVQRRPECSRGQWAMDSRTLPGCQQPLCYSHTTVFLPQQPLQHQQGQWDGEGGNAALDLLPVTVLIHSWLLLNQFLAVVHGADIAILLLPSKRSWKKCLLLVFPLYVQKIYPKQEQLSPDNVTG